MTAKFNKLKEQLKNLETGDNLSNSRITKNRNRSKVSRLSTPNWLRYALFIGFFGVFTAYAAYNYLGSNITISTGGFEDLVSWVDQPDEDLLEGMGSWMEEMGYTGLTREDLIELREQGVTATYTSRIRDLGYTDITLEEVTRLAQNDVSSTFAAMMKELGYDLSVEQMVQLRQHDVTAYYTSNLHDLGYVDITPEELIRLRNTGVTTEEVERLISERQAAGNGDGTDVAGENQSLPTIEELIRYHISNQQ